MFQGPQVGGITIMDGGKFFPSIAIYPENGMREAHSQGFLVCVARIFTQYGRKNTHFYG